MVDVLINLGGPAFLEGLEVPSVEGVASVGKGDGFGRFDVVDELLVDGDGAVAHGAVEAALAVGSVVSGGGDVEAAGGGFLAVAGVGAADCEGGEDLACSNLGYLEAFCSWRTSSLHVSKTCGAGLTIQESILSIIIPMSSIPPKFRPRRQRKHLNTMLNISPHISRISIPTHMIIQTIISIITHRIPRRLRLTTHRRRPTLLPPTRKVHITIFMLRTRMVRLSPSTPPIRNPRLQRPLPLLSHPASVAPQ